jgi:hypothetical protein
VVVGEVFSELALVGRICRDWTLEDRTRSREVGGVDIWNTE